MVIRLATPTARFAGPSSVTHGQKATLKAALASPAGKPIAGRRLTIVLGAGKSKQSCRTKPTDSKGDAICSIATVKLAKGKQPVTVTFAGDPKGRSYDYGPRPVRRPSFW